MSDTTWQQRLVCGHRHLFMRTYRGVAVASGYPACPDGWSSIVATMVERVASATAGYSVRFTQISQKLGILRVHWIVDAHLPKTIELAVETAIGLAEARSSCSCAKCGAMGQLFCVDGLLLPACPAHAQGEALPILRSKENTYLVRELVGDDISIISCRRYDRALDAFTAIDSSPDDHRR